MTSKLLLALLVGISPVVAQERERDSKSLVTARVTDRENTPSQALRCTNWIGLEIRKTIQGLPLPMLRVCSKAKSIQRHPCIQIML